MERASRSDNKMNYEKSEWNGFERLDFDLKGRKATLICPKFPRKDSKWIYKTEYLDAFPSFDLEMLNRGYYLAHLQNTSRWCPKKDTDKLLYLRDNYYHVTGKHPGYRKYNN